MISIDTLIDKQDNFEIIRDQIAGILALEVASQINLAESFNKDSSLWDLKIYTERTNPWEQWLNDGESNNTPLVNVWFDSSTFDTSASNTVKDQKCEGIFNIDCYGYGKSQGYESGDELASLEVQRAVRLVRNIIMSANYTYLDLRGTVWARFPQSITMFQPEKENHVQHIVAARISLRVTFSENSPQITGNPLETVSAKVKRAEDGEIVINADYNYTS